LHRQQLFTGEPKPDHEFCAKVGAVWRMQSSSSLPTPYRSLAPRSEQSKHAFYPSADCGNACAVNFYGFASSFSQYQVQ